VLSVATVAVLAAAGTASADGVTRYTTPDGTGVACTATTPCPIDVAINDARNGDTVAVASGTYDTGTTRLVDNAAITLVGIGPTPTIASQAPIALQVNAQLQQPGLPGSHVSNLHIVDTAPKGSALGVAGFGSIVERVTAQAPGNDDPDRLSGACDVTYGTLRDSICVATGDYDGVAKASVGPPGVTAHGVGFPIVLRNLTAIGRGLRGVGIAAENFDSGAAFHVTLVNVIARGNGAGGADLTAQTNTITAPNGIVSVAVTHSNYAVATPFGAGATIVDDGTKQSSAPDFVSVTGPLFDYHERSGSPTIGAGITDPDNGPFEIDSDPDGGVRTRNGLTDIGADEFPVALVPPPTTVPPTTTPPTTTTPTTTTPTTTTPTTDTTTTPRTTPTATTTPHTTTPITTTPGVRRDRTPPVLGNGALSPTTFAVRIAHNRKRGAHYGSTVRYTLSEFARVRGVVAVQSTGRLVGKTCARQTDANRTRRACRLWTTRGSFSGGTATGAVSVPFTGRDLAPGSYRIQMTATDLASNRSKLATLSFRVVKG
jgi:cell division septation protein DedD